MFFYQSRVGLLFNDPLLVGHPGEDGLQRVVVARAHWIELVVMAAGATKGQPEERRAGGADHSVEFVLPLHQGEVDVLAFDEVVRPRDEKAGADAVAEGVPGQLRLNEPVIRQVAVECVDHPVAERPGVGPLPVGLEAVRLAVPDDVEPMLRPPLAEPGIVQHAVDSPFPGVRP